MWKGFNVKIKEDFFKDRILASKVTWESLIACAKKSRGIFHDEIYSKITSGVWVLDGAGIESNWFPKVSNHVFISHSHADEQLALALAGALKKWLKIDSFVDSAIWGHFEELQKALFKKVVQNRNLADAEKLKMWNTVSAHVHCMLSKSLIQMIDQCECLIFLNTPSSISINDIAGKSATYSPWIYTEIEVSRLLRSMPDPRRHRTRFFNESNAMDATVECLVEYPLNLAHLSEKTGQDIWDWICSGHDVLRNSNNMAEDQVAFRALDVLYKQ